MPHISLRNTLFLGGLLLLLAACGGGGSGGGDILLSSTGGMGVATHIRSTSSSDVQTDAASDHAAVSENGRYIAFWTDATNLGGSTGNVYPNLYLKDVTSGTTTLLTPNTLLAPSSVSAAARPSTALGGRYIYFISPDHGLDSGTTSTYADVYQYDTLAGSWLNVSSGGECTLSGTDGDASEVSASQDGNYVAITTLATNTPGCTGSVDTNGLRDVYLLDLSGGFGDQLISTDSAGAVIGDGASYNPSIDNDGGLLAFVSKASNLITGQTTIADIYLKNTTTGALSLVSWNGKAYADGDSAHPSISGDGSKIAFESLATNLISGSTSNGKSQIYLWSAGGIKPISVDSTGVEGNNNSYNPQISKDGRFVIFESDADNLVAGDNNKSRDLFLHDTITGTTERLTLNSSGTEANAGSKNVAWSGNGQFVVFTSSATNLDDSRTDGNGVDDIVAMSLTDYATIATDTLSPILSASDVNGDPLSITTLYNFGTITDNGDGTVKYVGISNFQGLDGFTYTVTDGKGSSATGYAYVAVSPNFAPQGVFDTATTTLSSTISIDVMANDMDFEGDSFTLNSVSATSYAFDGSSAVISGNKITYTAPNIYTGVDTFTYTLQDSRGAISKPITVSVTVN